MSVMNIGQVLRNRYKISKVLFESKLTNVYGAEDLHLPGNFWAIKEMKFLAMDNIERQHIIAEFEEEVKTMSALSHPNIAKVIDFFVEGQNLYILREFIPAYDIATMMRKVSGPLNEAEVLSWGIQIADALLYLDSKKFPAVFYKELNLDNILVNSEGKIKLIDLGLARIFQTETNPELLEKMGSPDYSPPELFEEYGKFTRASLVYTMGAILYHIFTREKPSQHFFNLPSIDKFNPSISVATKNIIKRATMNNPEHRYQSLADMKKALIQARKNLVASKESDFLYSQQGESSSISPLILLIILVLTGSIAYLVYKLLF